MAHRERDEEKLDISKMDDHVVRAKKEYTCSNCKGSIFKGQRMRRIVYRDRKPPRKLHMDRVHVRCY